MKGKIVAVSFEDGKPKCDECDQIEKHCECPEGYDTEFTSITPGTYITVRLDDENEPVGFWDVTVTRENE